MRIFFCSFIHIRPTAITYQAYGGLAGEACEDIDVSMRAQPQDATNKPLTSAAPIRSSSAPLSSPLVRIRRTDPAGDAMALNNGSLGGPGEMPEDSNKDIEMNAAKYGRDRDNDELPGRLGNDPHENDNKESNDPNPQLNCNQLQVPAKQCIKLRGTAFKKVPSGPPDVYISTLILTIYSCPLAPCECHPTTHINTQSQQCTHQLALQYNSCSTQHIHSETPGCHCCCGSPTTCQWSRDCDPWKQTN